jgi:CRP-like cAMP-binding protein
MIQDRHRKILETLKLDIALGRANLTALADLAQSARYQVLKKGEYIFNDGDNSNSFYMVESGRVILSKGAPSGKAFTFLIAVRGTPLNMLASRVGPNLPMTNDDISDMTGISRETVARAISRLQKGGLLCKLRGQIEILDLPQLDVMATIPFFIL